MGQMARLEARLRRRGRVARRPDRAGQGATPMIATVLFVLAGGGRLPGRDRRGVRDADAPVAAPGGGAGRPIRAGSASTSTTPSSCSCPCAPCWAAAPRGGRHLPGPRSSASTIPSASRSCWSRRRPSCVAFEHLIPLSDRPPRARARARGAAAVVRSAARCSPGRWSRRLASSWRRGATGPRRPSSVASEEAQQDATDAYLDAGEQEGLIEGDERRLLQSVVDFGDTLVREVMTPRPDIVAIRSDATLDELRAFFREQEYSRIPVYADTLDNIVGLRVHQGPDAPGAERAAANRPASSIVRPAHVVPETKRVSELLREFQRQQLQMAIVVDEYGGTAGLVTLEDLLEEIVGEIRDEYDVETEPVVDEGDGAVLVSRQGRHRDRGRAARRRDRAGGLRDRRRLPAGAPRPRAGRRASGSRSDDARRRGARRRAPARSTACACAGLDAADGGTAPRRRTAPARSAHEGGIRRAGRPAQRRQVHAAQPAGRPEGRHRLGQAADDAQPHRRRAATARAARSCSSTRPASTGPCTA